MTKRAVVRISTDLLAQLLNLPDGMEVLHLTIAEFGLAFDLVVTAPDMADVDAEIGAMPPLLRPVYEVGTGGVMHVVDVDYPRQPTRTAAAAE